MGQFPVRGQRRVRLWHGPGIKTAAREDREQYACHTGAGHR